MTFQLSAVEDKSACKFRKKSTLAVQHCNIDVMTGKLGTVYDSASDA